MKLLLTYIAIFFCLATLGQVGKLDLKITLTSADTTYPYFLDTWVKKNDSIVSRIAITRSGLHHFGNFKEGLYNLELNDHRSRRRNIDNVRIMGDLVTTISISYPDTCQYTYSKNYKPVCPRGHSDSIVNILYGLPTNKAMEKAKRGLIYLGGCIVTGCDPHFYCKKHKLEF